MESARERPAARSALLVALALAALGHGALRAQAAVQAESPFPRGREPVSVLFIMSDQHTTRAMSCYENGFGGVPAPLTPNLDRIAEEGARFERAYCASPQCQPSRFSLLTGRTPHRHGLRWNGTWEPLDQTTFPELARRQGYATATIGKHHMAWPAQPPGFKNDLGFSVIIDLVDYEKHCVDLGVPAYDAAGQFWQVPSVPPAFMKIGYTHSSNELHFAGFLADEAVVFLQRRAPKSGGDGKPFVCWFSMEHPHPPVLPSGPADPHDWAHLYQPADLLALAPNLGKVATTTKLAELQQAFAGTPDAEWRELLSYYYGLVSQIDWNVGRVLDALAELDLADRTLVVYTADHGEMGTEMGCWTKGAGFYDALARVPLLMKLPGVIPAGRVISQPVDAVDLLPTLLELTGVYASDGVRARLDGESLVEHLLGAAEPEAEPAFSEFGTTREADVLRSRMIRRHDLKYTFDEINGGEEELYDLAADPYELENRIDDPDPLVQAEIEALRGELAAWWGEESTHAPEYLPLPEGTLLPVAAADPLPPPGATGVGRKVDPHWLPCTASAVQRVYLGTASEAMVLVAELGPMESFFNPGTLAPATAYSWRVDGTNAAGTTQGPVWSFTTEDAGEGGPGLAASPSPAQRAQGVALDVALQWTPPLDALSQQVFFATGEDALLPLGAPLPGDAAELALAPLSAGVAYRWRVDTTSAEGTTEGTVWSFTTDAFGLPLPARSPLPPHLQSGVSPSPLLRWTPGADALAHEIYFGTALPLARVATITGTGTELDPGPLLPGTTYYWRVDEVNAYGTRHGWTWRFTTAP